MHDTVLLGDMSVRRMGFGAMRITGPGIWGPPNDIERAHAVLRRAVAAGVEFIDTADAYGPGTSEELIAQALHPYPRGLVIATKGGLVRPGPSEWRPDGRPAHLREALEASLARLKVDRIDLYQLHRPDPKVAFADSVRCLADLRDAGKIRHVGLCNVSVAQLEEARTLVPIVSVQNRYNLRERHSDDVVDACERLGIAFLPWFPLGSGELISHDAAVLKVAKVHNIAAAQVALAWLLQRSPIMLPIPGTGNPVHLEENLGASRVRLSADDVRSLEVP